MRRGLAAAAVAALLLGLAGEAAAGGVPKMLTVESSAFEFAGDIPVQYSCDGENVSPPLEWSKPPKGTKEIAITVIDADVPAPEGAFIHWALWRIKPKVRELEEGSVPSGARQGATDAGPAGYFGPCPPEEGHRYIFTVYALSKKLKLDDGASPDEYRAALDKVEESDQVLASGFISGCYPTGCQDASAD